MKKPVLDFNIFKDYILNILRKQCGFSNKKSLGLLVRDSCSELSRLLACFILKKGFDFKVSIFKGKNIFHIKNKCHDILALIDKEDKVYLLDPAIWQFFPRKRNILVGISSDLGSSLVLASKIYGGKWNISEKLYLSKCFKLETEWLSVIKENCNF